jgi:hypothetical protein
MFTLKKALLWSILMLLNVQAAFGAGGSSSGGAMDDKHAGEQPVSPTQSSTAGGQSQTGRSSRSDSAVVIGVAPASVDQSQRALVAQASFYQERELERLQREQELQKGNDGAQAGAAAKSAAAADAIGEAERARTDALSLNGMQQATVAVVAATTATAGGQRPHWWQNIATGGDGPATASTTNASGKGETGKKSTTCVFM